MMCESVVDVYKDELKESECSFLKEWEEIRRESRREEDIRLNGMCKGKVCVRVCV
jgi:hypothetical protein